jgi:acetolactate synthase-1/3 small subunit
MNLTILDLTVNNHPGVMSHITGLFSRRAFNLEGIICGRIGNGEHSRMYLLVSNDTKLIQIEKQLKKLYDVIALRRRDDIDPSMFNQAASIDSAKTA